MIRYFPLLAPFTNCGPYGTRGGGMHYGVDLCAPTGTTIIAVDDGTVTYGSDALGGNVAVLHAQDGNAYYFAHMLDVQSGSRPVLAGDPIGLVDMTGNAQGTVPHTHFEWWPSGSFQRPAPDPTAQLTAAPQFTGPAPTPAPAPASRSYAGAVAAALGIIAASGAVAWAIGRQPARRRPARA